MKKYYKNSIYTVFLLPALILFTMFLIAPAFVMLPISFQNNNSIYTWTMVREVIL